MNIFIFFCCYNYYKMDWIENPLTGRYIKKNSKTYKTLVKTGVINENYFDEDEYLSLSPEDLEFFKSDNDVDEKKIEENKNVVKKIKVEKNFDEKNLGKNFGKKKY